MGIVSIFTTVSPSGVTTFVDSTFAGNGVVCSLVDVVSSEEQAIMPVKTKPSPLNKARLFIFLNIYTLPPVKNVFRKLPISRALIFLHPGTKFRRLFACMLAKRGMDIREIQKLLGHKNINTTMVYIVMDNASLQASYNKHIA